MTRLTNGAAIHREHAERQSPEHRALLLAALDAFEAILGGGPGDLASIVAAASSPAPPVWDTGTELLVELASRSHPGALDALLALSRSPKAGQRTAVLASAGHRLPGPVLLDLLRRGLKDRSEPVRLCALQRCMDLGVAELRAEIDAAVATLSDRHRERGDILRVLTVYGHHVARSRESATVTVWLPGRTVSTFVPLADVEPDRLLATVARLRAENEAELAALQAIAPPPPVAPAPPAAPAVPAPAAVGPPPSPPPARGTVLSVDPETGQLIDARDVARTVIAIVTGAHPDVRSAVVEGELTISSGDITVVDPVHHMHKQPLVPPVPAGKYGVSLAYAGRSRRAAAAVVRFAEGTPDAVERADWTFPFRGQTTFSLRSGIAAVFDYGPANRLMDSQLQELGRLLAEQADRAPGFVRVPRSRWNALAFRVEPAGDGFYSCHWVRAASSFNPT